MRRGLYKIRIYRLGHNGQVAHMLPYAADFGIITDDPMEIFRIAMEQGIPYLTAKEAADAADQVDRIRGIRLVFEDMKEGIEVWASKAPWPEVKKRRKRWKKAASEAADG